MGGYKVATDLIPGDITPLLCGQRNFLNLSKLDFLIRISFITSMLNISLGKTVFVCSTKHVLLKEILH